MSKTHSGPQPEQTVLFGVFNNKGPEGGVRASALKQYGLMEGDAAGYTASALARAIEAAVPEEKTALFQKAFLTPKLFKQIHDTLQSETASRARVRQVAITGKVHPESADECVECFINGAVHARLGALEGENVVLTTISTPESPPATEERNATEESRQESENAEESQAEATEARQTTPHNSNGPPPGSANLPNADVRVNLTVDSSSDPEKLEKQLKLLRQYGLLRS